MCVLGTLLLVASQSEDSDILWTVSNDSFPFQGQLMEAHVSVKINKNLINHMYSVKGYRLYLLCWYIFVFENTISCLNTSCGIKDLVIHVGWRKWQSGYEHHCTKVWNVTIDHLQSTIAVDGRTWAMCEVTSGEPNVVVDKPDPPAVVTQHSETPRKFILLSAQVCTCTTKPV